MWTTNGTAIWPLALACCHPDPFSRPVPQCQALLDSLARTRLCFSCAHGRPTTAPVVDLHLLRQALRLRAQAQQVGGGSSEAAGSTGVGLAGLRAKLKGLVG